MAFDCMLCKATEADIHPVRDAKDGRPIEIALCRSCGHVQLADRPDLATLQAFYGSDYRKTYRKADAPKPRHVFRAGRDASERLARLMAHVTPGARLLDIGAGGGEFVYLAGQRGLRAQGIDPSSGYLEFARENYGVEMRAIGVEALDPAERYDVITLFHVLEHLPAPREAIEAAAVHLDEGGLLYIEVPDLCAKDTTPTNLWFKAHLSYFTEETLRLIVEERFEILDSSSGRVLTMILRKRPAPQPLADLQARHAAAIDLSRRRIREKTFGEYLLNGGLLSPVASAARILREARGTRGRSAREILDALA